MPKMLVEVTVEPDREHVHKVKGICDNCGGSTFDDPIWVACISLENPENLDELCSWGCVLELSASIVAVAGTEYDARPNVVVREIE